MDILYILPQETDERLKYNIFRILVFNAHLVSCKGEYQLL